MPIVIGGGKSVNDYPVEDLRFLCKHGFTFAVNNSAFDWPCDIIVALDFSTITQNLERLKKINKPIITRKWENFEQFGLNLIYLPQDIIYKYPSSGMLACKISDRLAATVGKQSYVVGIDGTAGHYYDNIPANTKEGKIGNSTVDLKKYEDMKLTNTINLGMVHSRIPYWPKSSKLPHIRKVYVHGVYRAVATAWVCGNTMEKIA